MDNVSRDGLFYGPDRGVDNMSYYMYLDDIRDPKTDKPWHVVRSYQEAVDMMLEFGAPGYISFDHDLGEDDAPTGYDLAKWMVVQDMDKVIVLSDSFKFNVHSANPVGAANITMYLNAYMEQRAKTYKHEGYQA